MRMVCRTRITGRNPRSRHSGRSQGRCVRVRPRAGQPEDAMSEEAAEPGAPGAGAGENPDPGPDPAGATPPPAATTEPVAEAAGPAPVAPAPGGSVVTSTTVEEPARSGRPGWLVALV